MDTSKQLKPKRGVFRKNKVARQFAIAGLVFLAITTVFMVAGIIWPEAFYGCREILYRPPECNSPTPCITVDLYSSTHCSPFVLGWLTAIAAVCAVGCWLIALIWNWLSDKNKKSLRVMKSVLTAILIFEMVLTPIVLLFQTVTVGELHEVFSYFGEAIMMAMGILFVAGMILDVVWLVLILTTWVLVQIDKKRA